MLSTLIMMRGARIVLAVVAIFSIVYVLITPDLTDDVDGVLRPNHTAKAQRIASLPLLESSILAVVPFLLPIRPNVTQRLAVSELLDLVCICRC